ncbi:MAG: glycosyl transferase group 1 [Acidimicrobiales bacterium]|jgi:glycosyltransferase involved in cell wall biosynthesis|nr:glycosyl transferase group 1 [Acidimicrobiales bacterium]
MNRPLRVALLSPYSWPEVTRGGERYLHDLAWYLSRQGHEVDVVSGTSGPPSIVEAEGARFVRRTHRVPRPMRERGSTAFDTFGLIALRPMLRRRYDVVHSLAATGAVAARVAGQRVVYTVMGHPTPDQFGHRPLDRQLIGLGTRAARVTTTYSEASALAVHALYRRRATPLHLGIRSADFPVEPAPRTGPARLLFPAFAGERRKGLDHLLRAMALVLDRHPDARLQLLGGGDTDWAFESLGTDEPRVRAAIDDLGRHVGDVGHFYRSATVAVLPSKHEAFGVVLVESLASGTPVVCSDDGGMPEIVSSPAVGRVAPHGDPAALASAILEAVALAAAPGTPERCAEHARRWDWDTSIGPAHEALYRQVARCG